MDPFQINATYRQNELLEEAQAEALLKAVRTARVDRPATQLERLLGRLLGPARRLSRPRAAAAARKATV